MDNVLLSAEEVSARYNENEVLHKVSVSFKGGKITAVIGPNGSGKSTLLKTLIGFVPKAEGIIISEGVSLDKLSASAVARKIAYLPQIKSIPELSVRTMVLHGRFSHLSYPRRYRSEDIKAAEEALKTVGIEDLADKKVASLSGGTVQLVFLAMALAQNSPVILMDEPASFLDIAHQIKLMEMCKALARDGKAVVIVMHDIPMTLKYADEIAVMSEGRIAVTGTPLRVFESGILDKVFGVTVKYTDTESGRIYFCE